MAFTAARISFPLDNKIEVFRYSGRTPAPSPHLEVSAKLRVGSNTNSTTLPVCPGKELIPARRLQVPLSAPQQILAVPLECLPPTAHINKGFRPQDVRAFFLVLLFGRRPFPQDRALFAPQHPGPFLLPIGRGPRREGWGGSAEGVYEVGLEAFPGGVDDDGVGAFEIL